MVTSQMLIDVQISDCTLNPLFHRAVTDDDCESEPVCYYIQSNLLFRKFRPSEVLPANELWQVLRYCSAVFLSQNGVEFDS